MDEPYNQGNDEFWEAIELVGQEASPPERRRFLSKIAKSDKSILILGETGTGKDVLAKAIHRLSQRHDQPFVAINCASIPPELFEAELFGFSRGAFTGAFKEKAGLLEAAGKGSVFLDEIGELPLSLQAKLLRAIDNRAFRRLGEVRDRFCEARFIFATNKELSAAVELGTFRRDLYYRISVIQIRISPLRYNREAIPEIALRILARENRKNGVLKRITPEALEKLKKYDFPGNIRELVNIIERSVLLSEEEWIRPEDIKFNGEELDSLQEKRVTATRLREVLEACRWNKTEAAKKLGTSRRHLYRLLQKYRVDCFCF